MQVHYGFDDNNHVKKAVVTTGSFDGVHVGHMVIIKRINEIAKSIGGESCLITFHPHPRKVLYPDTLGKELLLINSQEEKIELLSKTGLDHLFIIDFTIEFSKTSSVDFIKNILLKKLNASKIVIGFNHHFGHNREGDYDELQKMGIELGFEFEEIPQQDVEHEAVSSTKIRKALLEGNIQRANAYLEHQYFIKSKAAASHEFYRGLLKNIIHLPLTEECKLVPPNGTYAIRIKSGGQSLKGMAILHNSLADKSSNNKRVDILPVDDETNIAVSGDITIYFQKRISSFESESHLEINKNQLLKDIELIEELIF